MMTLVQNDRQVATFTCATMTIRIVCQKKWTFYSLIRLWRITCRKEMKMLCKAIRVEESKEISHVLKYARLLISQMVGTAPKYLEHLGKRNETVKVKMTPTFEDRLTKVFYIAEPQQVSLEINSNTFFYSILIDYRESSSS